jgi:thiamine biosynthesis lipoprotein
LAPVDLTNAPPAQFVHLRHAALATSGDIFQHVEIDGRRYSHIVDPQTGIGLVDRSLVTVIAPDCATADSLATAVSVLGPERGLRLVRARRAVEARILRVPAPGRLEAHRTPGFERYLAGTPAKVR